MDRVSWSWLIAFFLILAWVFWQGLAGNLRGVPLDVCRTWDGRSIWDEVGH
jgi:hypothetical protein